MSEAIEQIEMLQNLLVSHATGETQNDREYRQLRQFVLNDPALKERAPRFLRTSRNLSQFWGFIKLRFSTYAERRQYIWDEFQPLFGHAESPESIGPSAVEDAIGRLDSIYVQTMWDRALERRQSDPDGAITLARTLLESVCKHILDETGTAYDGVADLPKLYRVTAEQLNLAPSQHSEKVFRQILGGCTAVVEGLGALRNRLSDAHGQGRSVVRPAPRHAELAVNLAGSMAAYLVATWEYRDKMTT